MIIQHNTKTDLTKKGCDPIISIMQGDISTHQIVSTMTKDGKPWLPPSGTNILVRYSNSYGKNGTYDTLPDGKPAWIIDGDTVSVTLAPQVLALPGSVTLVVSFLSGAQVLSAFKVLVMVEANAYSGAPLQSNYTNITGFLPAPDSATVGQFFSVEEVNREGKVVKIAAVDAPTSNEVQDETAYSPSATVIQTEEGAVITVSDKNGTTTATILHGEAGSKGPQGEKGETGAVGPQGPQGEKGETGAVGPQGPQGEKGETGAAGPQGPQGEKGETGAIGPQGPQGEKGETGAAGPQGPQGEKGATGSVGPAGKSAYAYALDGGYTGTEEEFATKLAAMNSETETVLSDNLFDQSIATVGQVFYHSSSGPSMLNMTTGFFAHVELRGAGTYRFMVDTKIHGESYALRIPLVTADKTFLRNTIATILDGANVKQTLVEVAVTADDITNGAAYICYDGDSAYLDTLMIVKDRAYPNEYIPYGYIEVGTDSNKKQDNVLYGKTAVFLGDSICAGTTVGDGSEYYGYGWAGLIGETNKMIWGNYGRNGGTITPITSVDSSRWVSTQVDLSSADHPDADYVIFEGGTNDADTLGTGGLGAISSDYATFDTSTFTGALESLLLKIMTSYPQAKVGYIVAQKMGNAPYTSAESMRRQYFDRAVEVCKKWGIPVLDLWNNNPLNPALTYHAQNYYTDKQHLTLAGYQRITPQIEAFLRNL